MPYRHLIVACAVLAASAAAAAADSPWPKSAVGTWKGMSNQSPIILVVSSETSGRGCENISGTIQDVNGGFSGEMIGYYCPSSGAVEFLRYPAGQNVPFQVYDGSLSQANPPPGVRGILMAGVFGQYNLSYGPLGQHSFSLTK